MSRIGNSFALARSSWAVLRADKELLLLPTISAATAIIVAVAAVVWLATDDDTPVAVIAVSIAVVYFLLAYTTVFFNAALVSATNERLQGGDPTIRSALRGAGRRAAKLVPWTFLSTVATLSRLRKRGHHRRPLTFGGVAWTLIVVLGLPIVVVEGTSAVKALKKSGKLIDATWGENLTDRIGLGLVGFVLFIPTVVLLSAAVVSAGTGAGTAAAVVGGLWGILVVVLMTALASIYQTALYHFAVTDDDPTVYFDHSPMSAYFADSTIESAFYDIGASR